MSGVWRDRTNLYISYRQSYAHHPAKKRKTIGPSANGFSASGYESEERRGLMSAGAFEDDGDAIIEMDVLPPRWVDIQDEVTELLGTIAKKSADLEKLHQKHVLPGFDDEDVKRQEEIAIERMTQDITRGFHDCQKAIQRVEMMVRDARHQGGVSAADETMARNIQISLASRVQEVSAGFRKKQSSYLKKLRTLGGLTFDRTSAPSQNPYSDPSMMESETDKSFSQSTLQQTSMKRLNTNDVAIAQREREIEDIAQGIIELADIFKELQGMVIDQGTMLDRIDYNIENMSVNVKAADKELNVATGYQKKYTKRKILFLLLLLVIGMFILLLVKPKRTKAPSPPPSADPIGTLGEVKPQPEIGASEPDIVQPNGAIFAKGMADIYAQLLNKTPSKGKAAMPKPTYCQSKILSNGMCETTEKALEQDRNSRASLKAENDPAVKEWLEKTLRKKENIILELDHRLTGWNSTKCHACNASLKGWGPQKMTEQELAYFEDPVLFNERAELAAQGIEVKDTKPSEAVTLLREILARK